MNLKEYFARSIKWNTSSDSEFPWYTTLEGKKARVRLNDFPADNLYTLLIGESQIDFDDWPSAWIRTSTKAAKKVSQTNGNPRGRSVKITG